jgi:hypothetical protein
MARLLTINVGPSNDIAWHEQTVHTAWKRAVAGRRMAGRPSGWCLLQARSARDRDRKLLTKYLSDLSLPVSTSRVHLELWTPCADC